MSFQPVVPLPGLAGYRFLQRTLEEQRQTFADAAEVRREIDHFLANIGKVDSAEALVSDRRLLAVALGAFGLGDEVDKRAFLRRILEDGSESREALANRLVDPKFREFAAAFGFGDPGGSRIGEPGFAADIAARFRIRAFEEAVGAVDVTMRLALNFDRGAAALAGQGLPEDTLILRLLGDNATAEVLRKGLGLPAEFAGIDLDQQLGEVRKRLPGVVGGEGAAALSDPEARDALIRRFLLRAQVERGPDPATPGFAALTLLGGGAGVGPGAIENLLASRF